MVLDDFDRIQLTLDHMEANLKAEIQISELGRMAGYSGSYYRDLFRRVTGLPLKQYLMHRRLAHALYEISKGMGMQDAALEYGFDTYAGFYRAFCRKSIREILVHWGREKDTVSEVYYEGSGQISENDFNVG